ncbi:SDR family oxidoreductase [Pseudonocardiaceae bacterium YIM PH 21723]|nr:SDR family oxidoreductase [Pseudonocardiaceae bacterium YIM PH 21723]
MPGMELNGKAVLITGAARGIGAELARNLAGQGAKIGLVGLEPELLEKLAAELGPGHSWAEADVCDQQAVESATAQVVRDLGGIDVIVANAGVAPMGTVRQVDPGAFARTVDINLTGVFRTVQAALPHIIERRGYVLVVSSLAAFGPMAGSAAYGASKAGAEAFANALRLEVAHLGVDVGSAHPSWVDTDMVRDAGADSASFEERRKSLPWPANSFTSVEECARLFAEGIRKRRRKVFVPKNGLAAQLLRNVVVSGIGTFLAKRMMAKVIPQLERESQERGRSFSEIVEAQRPDKQS